MGTRMNPELIRLLRERKLIRIKPDKKLVMKEINATDSDLQEAKVSFDNRKFKWATIQGYYSVFHSGRALLYNKGFREKSHRSLLKAIRELYLNEIDPSMFDDFDDAMDLREEADYGLTFSEEGASEVIVIADKFLTLVKKVLKIEK